MCAAVCGLEGDLCPWGTSLTFRHLTGARIFIHGFWVIAHTVFAAAARWKSFSAPPRGAQLSAARRRREISGSPLAAGAVPLATSQRRYGRETERHARPAGSAPRHRGRDLSLAHRLHRRPPRGHRRGQGARSQPRREEEGGRDEARHRAAPRQAQYRHHPLRRHDRHRRRQPQRHLHHLR